MSEKYNNVVKLNKRMKLLTGGIKRTYKFCPFSKHTTLNNMKYVLMDAVNSPYLKVNKTCHRDRTARLTAPCPSHKKNFNVKLFANAAAKAEANANTDTRGSTIPLSGLRPGKIKIHPKLLISQSNFSGHSSLRYKELKCKDKFFSLYEKDGLHNHLQ